MTLAQIQALMVLANAGVSALGINAFQQVDMTAAQGALAELQSMADEEAKRLEEEQAEQPQPDEG